jgi:hypothetical protein
LKIKQFKLQHQAKEQFGVLTFGVMQSWGQISGMDTDQGSVQATISVAPQITGEELNTTTDTAIAGASAEITLTNSNLTTTTDVTSVFGGELVVVEVSSPANDEWGTEPNGVQGFWGVGDGITIIYRY